VAVSALFKELGHLPRLQIAINHWPIMTNPAQALKSWSAI
jgi:hypothetical protein